MRYPGKGPHPIQYLYPRKVVARRYPSRYFGENELSPGLITLSVLPTSHPLSFQPKWVRSSTRYNSRFNLLMGRSPGFASTPCNYRAINTWFPYGYSPKGLNLLQNVTRRIIMQKARRHTCKHSAPTACRHTVSGSFPPLDGVLFIFHSRYLVRYRSLESI